jgi:hypothetical protein
LSGLLCIVVGLLIIALSVAARARRISAGWRMRARETLEPPSPVGEALREFVSVAGGTYLGLSALAEFLKLELPEHVSLWGVTFDPLALIALMLGLLTPFLPLPPAR